MLMRAAERWRHFLHRPTPLIAIGARFSRTAMVSRGSHGQSSDTQAPFCAWRAALDSQRVWLAPDLARGNETRRRLQSGAARVVGAGYSALRWRRNACGRHRMWRTGNGAARLVNARFGGRRYNARSDGIRGVAYRAARRAWLN